MKGHNIPQGDFPDVNKFRHTLATSEACRDFSKFKKLDDRLLQQLDAIIANDIGALLQHLRDNRHVVLPPVVLRGSCHLQQHRLPRLLLAVAFVRPNNSVLFT